MDANLRFCSRLFIDDEANGKPLHMSMKDTYICHINVNAIYILALRGRISSNQQVQILEEVLAQL